jgi:formylglycine-generating enzyme required for sulfatase activity
MTENRRGNSASAPSFLGLRIFISYPRGGSTETWAERVEADLKRRGAEVFRDVTGIKEGDDNWYQRIVNGLANAHVVACVVGQHSDNCKWQQREMLAADRMALPAVAFRVAAVNLPLYMAEKQPVEWHQGQDEVSLETLARALAVARPLPVQVNAVQGKVPSPAQRQSEESYLSELLHSRFSTHEDSYVPLAGQARQAQSLERVLKGLRMPTQALLQAFKQEDNEPQAKAPVPYKDVLDAYLALPQRKVRRMVVLGEPGAGKSFSLQRLAVHHARAALADAAAPVPLLINLGLWTRETSLQMFAQQQLGGLGDSFNALLDQRRAVLLLDGLNEIPPGQRVNKAVQVRAMAEDERFLTVLVSCRERDFEDEFKLPFDRLKLLPLTPLQVHSFVHQVFALGQDAAVGSAQADALFWQIAGGADIQRIWQVWQKAGASFDQFWTATDIPKEEPNVHGVTSGPDDLRWRAMRADTRSLLALAANPYLLTIMAQLHSLGGLPNNRADLFDGFLTVLHSREYETRDKRGDSHSVPALAAWKSSLAGLAECMQNLQKEQGAGNGASTSLPRGKLPAPLTTDWLNFSVDASVLQRVGDDVRFTHQLLQESLASRVLLDATAAATPATQFWPAASWWQTTGWEVVAEIAAEACAGDPAALDAFIAWLAKAQPETAAHAWQRAGQPALSAAALAAITKQWLHRMTDAQQEPAPAARAAIGRALAALGLDSRAGVGLLGNKVPDIEWACIAGNEPFVYQGKPHPALPSFDLAKYPITNGQFQAFVKDGGYQNAAWWQGLGKRFDAPAEPAWADANAPRERVSWFEAMAFCRWLSDKTGTAVSLPTELQWEYAASGTNGRKFPWGPDYVAGQANCNELGSQVAGGGYIERTTAVGIYPFPSKDGVHDMAGNVWEWCLDLYEPKLKNGADSEATRVLRGGSWSVNTRNLRAADRTHGRPGDRDFNIGFRVCRVSPIEKLVTGALNAEKLAR